MLVAPETALANSNCQTRTLSHATSTDVHCQLVIRIADSLVPLRQIPTNQTGIEKISMFELLLDDSADIRSTYVGDGMRYEE
jgi:hypothetical protein